MDQRRPVDQRVVDVEERRRGQIRRRRGRRRDGFGGQVGDGGLGAGLTGELLHPRLDVAGFGHVATLRHGVAILAWWTGGLSC
jgi:hypothetical protein